MNGPVQAGCSDCLFLLVRPRPRSYHEAKRRLKPCIQDMSRAICNALMAFSRPRRGVSCFPPVDPRCLKR